MMIWIKLNMTISIRIIYFSLHIILAYKLPDRSGNTGLMDKTVYKFLMLIITCL